MRPGWVGRSAALLVVLGLVGCECGPGPGADGGTTDGGTGAGGGIGGSGGGTGGSVGTGGGGTGGGGTGGTGGGGTGGGGGSGGGTVDSDGGTDAGADAGSDAGTGGGGGFDWPFDGGDSPCPDAGETVELTLPLTDGGFQLNSRLLVDEAGLVLTWSDNSTGTWVARVTRLSPSGAVTMAPRSLLLPNVSLLDQNFPSIAARDGGYGAMLQYRVLAAQNVYFAPLDLSLNATGVGAPNGAAWGTSPTYLPSWPTPVWNPLDREWGLFWHQIGSSGPPPRHGVWMGRAQPDGTFLERHPVVPQEAAGAFEGPVFGQGAGRGVVWNGSGYAFAYVENRTTGVSLTRLSRDGGFVSAASTGTVADVFPNTSLAWNGNEYGLVWLEWGTPQKLRFRRADQSGAFLGQVQDLALYSAPPLQGDRPRPMAGIVSTGDGWFVTWLQFENGDTTSQLWGVKLALDGTEVAGTRRRLTCAAQSTMLPDVVWAGSYAAVSFSRGIAGTAPYALGLVLHKP